MNGFGFEVKGGVVTVETMQSHSKGICVMPSRVHIENVRPSEELYDLERDEFFIREEDVEHFKIHNNV